MPQLPKESRDSKNKYVTGLVDQAVKSLCEIWRPQDIPTVFLTFNKPTISPEISLPTCRTHPRTILAARIQSQIYICATATIYDPPPSSAQLPSHSRNKSALVVDASNDANFYPVPEPVVLVAFRRAISFKIFSSDHRHFLLAGMPHAVVDNTQMRNTRSVWWRRDLAETGMKQGDGMGIGLWAEWFAGMRCAREQWEWERELGLLVDSIVTLRHRESIRLGQSS
ncbi:hypothetical protein C8F01DRAFT_1256992 [Mycena amicta]|nr:hypothetical protein C8F01DRAFT_1256992 [Mycena amicta]